MGIVWKGAQHFTAGRRGYSPEAIVVHIMEGSLTGTDAWFQDPASKVSAHYGIGQNGEVHQYVDDSDTAWHAGRRYRATWDLIKNANPNYYTIGIEHEGRDGDPWADSMYQASGELIHSISLRWNIPLDRLHVIGHREIYTRKTCPGSVVDIDHLIDTARNCANETSSYNSVSQNSEVTTTRNLNQRRAPAIVDNIVATTPQGTTLEYISWVSNGQAVNGNSHWYKNATGNYFWAGGTDKPIPNL